MIPHPVPHVQLESPGFSTFLEGDGGFVVRAPRLTLASYRPGFSDDAFAISAPQACPPRRRCGLRLKNDQPNTRLIAVAVRSLFECNHLHDPGSGGGQRGCGTVAARRCHYFVFRNISVRRGDDPRREPAACS